MNERMMGTIGVQMDASSALTTADALQARLERLEKQASRAMQQLASNNAGAADKLAAINKRIAATEEMLTKAYQQNSRERIQAKKLEAEQQRGTNITTRGTNTSEEQRLKGERELKQRYGRIELAAAIGNQRRLTLVTAGEERRRTLLVNREMQQRSKDAARIQTIIDRTTLAPLGTREKVLGAIGGPQMKRRRDAMIALGGYTDKEAFSEQLSSVFGPQEAHFLATGGTRPATLGGKDQDAIQRTRKEMRELQKDARQVELALKRAMLAPVEVQKQVAAALQGTTNQLARMQAVASGATYPQAIAGQLQSRGFTSGAATFLGGGGGRRPVNLGGTPPGGGGGLLGRLLGMGGGGAGGALLSSLAGGFGVGLGGYALARGIGGLTENVDRATAYERQTVAASKLAGSQAQLNALLNAYTEASGGAIGASTSLANVSRLLATGYAQSTEEVSRFVKATRGASLAVGRPQDYIIQETQLAISNTSFRRLDQIGLGIEEVQQRIRSLRKENQGMTREAAFQIAVLDAMEDKYSALAESQEGQATGVELLRKEWENLGLAIGLALKGPFDEVADYMSERIKELVGAVKFAQLQLQQTRSQRDVDREYFEKYGRMPSASGGWAGGERMYGVQSIAQDLSAMPSRVRFGHLSPPSIDESVSGGSMRRTPVLPNEEIDAIKSNFYDKFQKAEQDAARQRLDLIRNYEQQREDIIVAFAKNMVREEEDFARSRARGLRDYERSILDVMREAQDREAEMQEDLDEKIAEMREDADEKLADVEEKYRENREKAEKDHRERLLKAAGQLDAIAILEERKRWKREREEAEEKHQEQIDEINESLQEQLEDAREAHAEQLEDAREADAKRLEDMRTARARQLADEDEDREIRKQRAIQDHNDQLAEMDRLHGENLAKLATQAAEQQQLIQDELEDALGEVGYYVDGLHEKMMEKNKIVDDWFDTMIDNIEKRLLFENDPGRYQFDPNSGPQIPLDYGSRLGITPAVSSNTNNVNTSSRSVVIAPGAIVVHDMGGAGGGMIGERVLEAIVDALENY